MAEPVKLSTRCEPIELLLLDVDGVLTDGVIAVDDRGVEVKCFHVRDGWAISHWRKHGKRVAILSGRWAPAVEHRAAELGIDPVIQGTIEKAEPFRALLADLALEPRQVCYIGDDLPDMPILQVVGLAACPADAVAEVRAVAHLVTKADGGRGAVREVIETLLKHQGAWNELVERLSVPTELSRA